VFHLLAIKKLVFLKLALLCHFL